MALHPAWTYTLRDLAGAGWGVLVFAAALVAPGCCLAHAVNSTAMRIRSLREQLAWSVALSFGPGVLLVVAAVALGGATAAALLLAMCSAIAVWLFRSYSPRHNATRKQTAIVVVIVIAWICLVLGSLVDIGTDSRLWMSVTAYDHGLRTAFVDAVLRTGVPPVDPVFWPGHDTSARYYYFWYAVCAAVARLAHISGRQALMASCVWPPLGIIAMLSLSARYMLHRRGKELTRLIVTATALLGVTGLDLLVVIALHIIRTPVMPDMEWWSMDPVASWLDTFLWAPHHVAALVAALLGLLLLFQSTPLEPVRKRCAVAALAGLSFAAAFGMSAYVGVAAIFLVVGWLVATFQQKTIGCNLRSVLVAACTSGACLLRFLWQLTRHDGASSASAFPLYFGLREVLDPAMLTDSPLLRSLAMRHPWGAREIAAAVFLIPGWLVELGFCGAVLVAVLLRLRRAGVEERTILWFCLWSLAGASVVRSGIIITNDYGIRAALFPQFFLLLLGALVFGASAKSLRRFLWLLILIGAGGCTYQLVLLRTYLPWQQAHGNPDLRDLAERTYALRQAYAALQPIVPASARIQYDLASTGFYLYPHLLLANRQIVTAELTCSTSFGGDPAACPLLQKDLVQLFPPDSASVPQASRARLLCGQTGAQYLVVTRWDPAWQARSGWVWTLPASVEQTSARVVACAP